MKTKREIKINLKTIDLYSYFHNIYLISYSRMISLKYKTCNH
jgi:hypothetical protein